MLGHRIPFDLLAAVTGVAEDELIAVLRDLVTRGVLVESGEDEFAFRHALVREAIAEQMLGRQRRRLHEAALDVLLRPGRPTRRMVAHHARGAGRYDDMVAAARRGTALYLSIGSAYQALQLAEMGLDEVPDDTELLRRGPGGLAGRPARRRGPIRPALARPGGRRPGPGRRALPAGPAGLGGRRDWPRCAS